MTETEVLLGVALSDGFGVHPGAWRMPTSAPDTYTSLEVPVRLAQKAERGGLDYIFYQDRVFLWGDLELGPPVAPVEPLMMLTAVAHATRRIGLVSSSSTSFNEPYTLARQFRALDVLSHGRAGWNAIPSYEPEAFANYGLPVPQREEKYERLHEVVQITQALWGSWSPEAGQPDPVSGRFADPRHIQAINLQGRYVASRGPLQIPPSEQGQPVIFMPFASGLGIQAAGMYANGIVAMPQSKDESRMQRDMIRSITAENGRNADEVKLLSFICFGLGATQEEAVRRRMVLEEAAGLERRLTHLSALLGLRLNAADADKPLTSDQVSRLRPHPGAPQAARAVQLANQALSPLEILGHGVLDLSPGVVGTPEQVADLIQDWTSAGACDGFTLMIDDLHDGLDDFVDHVVPILRRRGLRANDYSGTTLRDHLGLPAQFGPDPRVSGSN